jgi:polysaccharide deacetylase family protein (PEP-CTERM system associated)
MRIANVLTIDVEEWYHPEALRGVMPIESWPDQPSHVERQVGKILDVLDERNVRATFFVLGQVARRAPDLVRRIADAGHEVASHGDGHLMITDLSPGAFRADLVTAREALEDASGQRVLGYRAPTFSVIERTRWALDVIRETGHVYDASIYPIHHDRYGIPDSPRFPYRHTNGLAELPGSTLRLAGTNLPIGGGGYLRLLPFGVNLVAMTYVNTVEKEPFMVYLHPWETDPEQPRVDLPLPRRIRHYRNIPIMLDRLRSLLRRFRFTTAREVLAERGLVDA